MLIFDLLKRALTGTLIDPCRYFFPWGGGASDVDIGDNIPYSLMLDPGSSQYLSKAVTAVTNPLLWTYSAKVKLGASGSVVLLDAQNAATSGSMRTTLEIYAGQLIFTSGHNQVSTEFSLITNTNSLFRDPTDTYSIKCVYDSANATASERARLYVNNVRITSFSTPTYPTASYASAINAVGVSMFIGIFSDVGGSLYSDCLLSSVNFVDGQAQDTAFDRFSADTGQCVNNKYTGTYGANGFKLEFLNGAALGADTSSNGNNWTLNGGISSANQFTDTPTNSYCTLNPLNSTVAMVSAGNLTTSYASGNQTVSGTQAIPKSVPIYFEGKVLSATNSSIGVGIGVMRDYVPITSSVWGGTVGVIGFYSSAGGFLLSDAGGSIPGLASVSANEVLQIAINGTNLWIGRGNVWYDNAGGVTGNPSTGANPTATLNLGYDYVPYVEVGANTAYMNFGQKPFIYAPPTGFKALCSANLPTPAILKGSSHYTTKLDTGANIKATCEATYPYLLEWIKDRANANNHQLLSTVSGLAGNALQSNTTSPGAAYSAPAGSSVGWCWNLAQAAAANNAGSIPSSVSANITAGIAVGTYTGTGANATVGHGLGFAPAASDGYMLLVKDTTASSANNWMVMHSGFTSAAYYAVLNSAAAEVLDATAWQSTAPTSAVFSIGTNAAVNANGHTYEFILFFGVKGFSKFGTWTATGVAATAPFVYMGFKPALIGGKFKSQSYNWMQKDNARNPNNPANLYLYPCTTGADASDATSVDDFVSNGLKMRSNSYFNGYNASSVFAYYAFAEVPQKFATAR